MRIKEDASCECYGVSNTIERLKSHTTRNNGCIDVLGVEMHLTAGLL